MPRRQRDPQMHQTRKGKQWYFGMKVHTGTDADSGLVHTVKGTAANVADVNVLGELLHGDEESLHGDSAYHSKELKAQAEASGIEFNVNQRGTKQPSADPGAAASQPALVSGPGGCRASVPGGQAPVGAREGALPRNREESRADEHLVRAGQPVPCSIPVVESIGEVRP